ncbi:MAG: hypothetical protein PF588_02475 [Candidatus Kapabacteria bacterium]|jgi:hypothetical protein|nr:hypothetical protein [Candidatus Kapabacteria bacterium]
MRFIILFLTGFLSASSLFAQPELAIIKSAEGSAKIYTEQNSKSKMLGKIKTDELFYCEETDSDWWEVTYFKKKKGEIQGNIHDSKIQLFYDLPVKTQKKRIRAILERQKYLALKFYEMRTAQDENADEVWADDADSIPNAGISYQRQLHHDEVYEILLETLPDYFCENQDWETLRLVFEVADAEWYSSCLETPTIITADVFTCNPEIVKKLIENTSDVKKKNFMIETIDNGLEQIFSEEENEYIAHKKKLDGIWVVKR